MKYECGTKSSFTNLGNVRQGDGELLVAELVPELCDICMEHEAGVRVLPCAHIMCADCADKLCEARRPTMTQVRVVIR
eukprot:2722553-Pyramimonas_sp.AAC.1